MACAPPTRTTFVSPQTAAAARITGGTAPVPRPGGVVTTISRTPATCAGMALISSDEGSGAVPPAT